MTFPYDLDEIDEAKLQSELTRRQQARSNGCCDYCGQPAGSPPCRMVARHVEAMDTAAIARTRKTQPTLDVSETPVTSVTSVTIEMLAEKLGEPVDEVTAVLQRFVDGREYDIPQEYRQAVVSFGAGKIGTVRLEMPSPTIRFESTPPLDVLAEHPLSRMYKQLVKELSTLPSTFTGEVFHVDSCPSAESQLSSLREEGKDAAMAAANAILDHLEGPGRITSDALRDIIYEKMEPVVTHAYSINTPMAKLKRFTETGRFKSATEETATTG